MPQRQTGMPTLPLTALETTRRADPLDALRALFGMAPVSSDPAYDAMTEDDPDYQTWSSARPTAYSQMGDDSYGQRVAQSDAATSERLTALRQASPSTRNNASVALLRKLFGLGADDGSISQVDLEAARRAEEQHAIGLDEAAYERKRSHGLQESVDTAATYARPDVTSMRREDLSNKERLATAPGRVAGEYGLRNRALQNEGEIERQRIASQGVIDAARSKGGSGSHLAAGTLERVAGASNVVAGLSRLRVLRDQTSLTGPVAGRVGSALQQMPFIESSKEYAALKSETSNIENNLMHTLSGAAVTPTEQERLRGQIPLVTDKPEVWEQKANALERSMRGLNHRIQLLAAGASPSDLDQIPIDELADDPSAQTAAPPTDDVVGITRGGGSTGNAFGDLMQRASRAARPR